MSTSRVSSVYPCGVMVLLIPKMMSNHTRREGRKTQIHKRRKWMIRKNLESVFHKLIENDGSKWSGLQYKLWSRLWCLECVIVIDNQPPNSPYVHWRASKSNQRSFLLMYLLVLQRQYLTLLLQSNLQPQGNLFISLQAKKWIILCECRIWSGCMAYKASWKLAF